MFTGIVQKTALVLREPGRTGGTLELSPQRPWEGLHVGESISVNGACLTLVRSSPQKLLFHVASETAQRTNLGILRRGDRVNLERSLKAQDLLGGHLILGHVDCLGRVRSLREGRTQTDLVVSFPSAFELNVVRKGSVAVNGVSLTVVDMGRDWFSVALVPFTLEETNLSELKVGDWVNLEFDYIGKWVLKAAEKILRAGSDTALKDLIEKSGLEDLSWV